MKTKIVLVIIAMLLAMPMAMGILVNQNKSMMVPHREALCELEPRVVINTDKLYYTLGEPVEITYRNIGTAVAGFVIGTARPVIPWIIEADTGRVLFLTDPLYSHPCVMMYSVLEPGDTLIIEWDQQYFGYYDETFTPSEQVPPGEYYVELGYWKVVGAYDPPYMVPGGPPEYTAQSEVFTIS